MTTRWPDVVSDSLVRQFIGGLFCFSEEWHG
jgi:hypothetical protein